MKLHNKAVILFLAIFMLFSSSINGQTISYFETGEEFCGPFPSWKNIKTDYGAKGDGTTDDAAVIKTALAAMKAMDVNIWSVLYFPAGTYRINSTIYNSATTRAGGDDFSGMTIIGEDPATTVISWNGASGGTMFISDGWYGKISRLTFDGKGVASVGLSKDGLFCTGSEFSDLVFKDFSGNGIDLSAPKTQNGQAESSILRCKFINCATGILSCNWNSLDEWAWYCLFQDCGTGINQCSGSFQIFGNAFVRSKTADISGNVYFISVVNNISIGSKIFWSNPKGILCGNKIYNTTNSYSMAIGDVMINNTIKSATGSTSAVSLSTGNHMLVGNTFGAPPMPTPSSTYRYFVAEQEYVHFSDIHVPDTIYLPGTPRNMGRTIFEVAKGTGDDAAEIQKQIMRACTTTTVGNNPIVHIPKGSYSLKRTVSVPSKKEVQIVGDGTERGTIIGWSGTGTGPGFRLSGPSRVTMRDIFLNFANNVSADIMLIDNCDYPAGGRIFCDGVTGGGYTAGQEADIACLVDGVDNSDITIRNGGFSCITGGGLVVRGGRSLGAGVNTGYQVDYLAGALGNTPNNLFDVRNGGRLVAMGFRDETPMEGTILNLTSASSGFLSVAAMSWAMTPSLSVPVCKTDGFKGTFTFLANSVGAGYGDNSGSVFTQVTGNGTQCKVLNTCNDYSSQNSNSVTTTWKDNSSPAAQAAMLNCSGGPVNGSRTAIPNVFMKSVNTLPDTPFVLDAVSQFLGLHTDPPIKKPDGVTDVKLIRVRSFAGKGRKGFIFRADTSKQNIITPAIKYA